MEKIAEYKKLLDAGVLSQQEFDSLKHELLKNSDMIVGQAETKEPLSKEPLSKNKVGEVRVDGKKWSATSSVKISEGEEVEIVAIDGVKLKVKKGN